MLIKAKKIDNLQTKVLEYKNKQVVKYLKLRGYDCDTSKKNMIKIKSLLKTQMKKVVIEVNNERIAKVGSYYTWEANIKVKIIDVITGKQA